MKRALFLLVTVAGIGAISPTLHSQAPAPAPATETGNPLEKLKANAERVGWEPTLLLE